jgi:3-oxoacyl-[acyl-carrier protein] reductase
MFDLSGKNALVTGATGGIGAAIAEALHEHGATLALSGTRQEVLAAAKNRLGSRAQTFECNLADAADAERLVPAVEAAMGSLDILVNNAGVTRDSLAIRMKDEDWSAVLDINLTASFRLSRAALRGMLRRRHGRIISVTSVVAVAGNPGQANYAAAKAGIIGLTKSLAREVAGRGITVNCIAPGFVDTAMTASLSDGQKQAILASVPAGRLGGVREIAAAAVYLASSEAAYVTGQTLHVNGGMVMI